MKLSLHLSLWPWKHNSALFHAPQWPPWWLTNRSRHTISGCVHSWGLFGASTNHCGGLDSISHHGCAVLHADKGVSVRGGAKVGGLCWQCPELRCCFGGSGHQEGSVTVWLILAFLWLVFSFVHVWLLQYGDHGLCNFSEWHGWPGDGRYWDLG